MWYFFYYIQVSRRISVLPRSSVTTPISPFSLKTCLSSVKWTSFTEKKIQISYACFIKICTTVNKFILSCWFKLSPVHYQGVTAIKRVAGQSICLFNIISVSCRSIAILPHMKLRFITLYYLLQFCYYLFYYYYYFITMIIYYRLFNIPVYKPGLRP
jgi:hypothetical protein